MPRILAAASSSFRRIAASSARDETFKPEVLPASPSVAHNTVMRAPAAAYLANVPPAENVSSSGCAYIAASVFKLISNERSAKPFHTDKSAKRKRLDR